MQGDAIRGSPSVVLQFFGSTSSSVDLLCASYLPNSLWCDFMGFQTQIYHFCSLIFHLPGRSFFSGWVFLCFHERNEACRKFSWTGQGKFDIFARYVACRSLHTRTCLGLLRFLARFTEEARNHLVAFQFHSRIFGSLLIQIPQFGWKDPGPTRLRINQRFNAFIVGALRGPCPHTREIASCEKWENLQFSRSSPTCL